MAGILDKKVSISLNGKKVKVQSFLEYVNLYQLNKDDSAPAKKSKDDSDDEGGAKTKNADYLKVHEWINKRWEVVVTCSEGQFVQASFVNGICTSRGGTHVDAIIDQITQKLAEHVKKKHKDLSVKPFQIKNNLAVFINCLIENPAFDSQTKETLTTPPDRFGSEYAVSDKFVKDVLKCGAVDFIVSQAMAKERVKIQKVLSGKKTDKVLGVPKLEDANWAGTKQSAECLLILTEGDSAKALAMAGLDIVGRDRFGVFPLRGKLLNVRDVSNTVLKENAEIQAIVKILGLRFDMQYTETSTLRYGGLLIMADQDHDGSHIKGLIINFIHYFWPSLIKLHKFMKEFVTPVIKVTRVGGEPLSFFTIKDFKAWQAEQPQEEPKSSYKIKYYKGLGTSTNDEARQYFKDITKHVITFKYAGRTDDDLIELAFAKSKADDRKKWIENSRPEDNVDHSVKYLTYTDFINKELVQYSIASNLRAIPSVIDGFKPGQRKIMFGCFKRNLKQEVKVAQLTGYVAEHSAYHHGEASLSMTIVGMAQDFIGSNNIGLLEPLGQFGSRSMGGKDSASPRYIFTKLCPLTRTIFSELDDPIMERQEDDGMLVEPTFYAPVIPLVLANGASGIGMGWSTYVPPHNPLDLVENIRRMLDGLPPFEMDPWFYGFRGTVVPENAARTSYAVTGLYRSSGEDTIEVTELPVGVWTNDYKDHLEELMTGQKGYTHVGKVRELHKRGTVHFDITFKPGVWEEEYATNPEKKLKLVNSISLKNMVLFGQDGKIFKFDRATDILIEFFHFRLNYYRKRKDYLLKKLSAELRVLQNKVKFVRDILDSSLVVNNVKKEVLEAELTKRGFDKWSTLRAILEDSPEADSAGDEDSTANEFDYLLGLKIWQLTYEKAQALQDSFEKKELEKIQLERKTPEDLWRLDLNVFEEAYKIYVGYTLL